MKLIVHRAITVLCIMFLIASLPLSVFAAETAEQDYATLFQQAADAGESLTDLAPALSEALHNDPIGFLKALAQQDMTLWDTVGNAIVAYHSDRGEELVFLEFLLNIFSSDGFEGRAREAFLPLLMRFHADVSGADDEFVTALLNASRYSDGISADKLGIYIYELFLDDPVRMLHRFFEEDEGFQENMLLELQYQSYNQDAEYISVLNDLSTHSELSEAEKAFVSKLMEELQPTPSESTEATDPTEASAPTESTDATEPSAPSTPIQDDPAPSGGPTGGIILAALVLAAAITAAAIHFGKKKQ